MHTTARLLHIYQKKRTREEPPEVLYFFQFAVVDNHLCIYLRNEHPKILVHIQVC